MFSTLHATRQRLRSTAPRSKAAPAAVSASRAEQDTERQPGEGRDQTKGEEGSTAVELVILTPLMFLLVLLIVQFALFLHARQVVTAAAEQGVRSERLSRAGGGEGAQTALAFAARVGGKAVTGVNARVARGADAVTVNVSGEGQSIIPWMHLTVTGTSSGSIDQWTGDVS
ncbi:TadE family protein (plasmid) [Kineococcus radiotolerans SRS30216 = ATCC BAA-149]|uniref:TadE family protein n=2 Tax=Kineococcus radiotolerans TaxID=131568 RepID=A6WH18_KINRD|nr:TadE family protein [Kineococcus radiotolerans SRS30216 = ATCC BAA-149]